MLHFETCALSACRWIKTDEAMCVYGNIKVLNHQKALEYDLCSMFCTKHIENGKVYLKYPTHVFT